jgi:uncharacterized protein YndB with AHSA1/START domain
MTVLDVQKDPEARTLTLTATFPAPPAEVWQLWADPRLLERWWGPPTYPATVVEHQLTTDARVTYFMTGPEGDRHHGWWRVLAVDPPHGLEFEDGFADAHGQPDLAMPTMTVAVTIQEQAAGGTLMTMRSSFPSAEAMDQLVGMGMVDGVTAAVGQMDALLASSSVG